MRDPKRLGSIPAIALLVLMPAISRADSNTVLSGHVYLYGTNAGIAGAQISASSPAETRIGRTDKSGRFVFLGLLPDIYTVTVFRDGYDVCLTTRVVVAPGESEYLTAPLERAMLDGWTRGTAVRSSSSYLIY